MIVNRGLTEDHLCRCLVDLIIDAFHIVTDEFSDIIDFDAQISFDILL